MFMPKQVSAAPEQIPHFGHLLTQPQVPVQANDEFMNLISAVEGFLGALMVLPSGLNTQANHMHSLMEHLVMMRRNRGDPASACALLQKVSELFLL